MQKWVGWKLGVAALLFIAVVGVLQIKASEQKTPERIFAPAGPQQEASAVTHTDGQPRLLDLGSASCVPCKMMQPVLADLRREYPGRLQVEFIDVWKDAEAGRRYGIEAIPTQILFDAHGKEFFRHTGFYPREEIIARFREQGTAL